jgi:hypothetical protein
VAADVPAYITQPSFVQNSAVVKAGTNWDFSRGAVATPIVALPDPQPIPAPKVEQLVLPFTQYVPADQMPGNPPLVVVGFGANDSNPALAARADLRQLDKSVTYVVAGHADAAEKGSELLSRKRANSVATQMRKRGYRVKVVKSFGERRPLTADRTLSVSNRRVDVIAID